MVHGARRFSHSGASGQVRDEKEGQERYKRRGRANVPY